MIKSGENRFALLDCTLRDGGYYTNWDFNENLVDDYFKTMNRLPVNFIEIGYRSKLKEEYAGAYYYLPEFILRAIKAKTDKKLAIILNEKEVRPDDLDTLLDPCHGLVDMVRLAVNPDNYKRAIMLAKKVKDQGFLVSFNLMYASKWSTDFILDEKLVELNAAADYFYVVDSYGGLYPDDVKRIFNDLNNFLTISIGFHGHNNLEMALANSLTAINAGADVIDSTVLGMGRGAGNLKTELILTILNQQKGIPIDFDALNNLTHSFLLLHDEFKWGTNLQYMVSGAFSLAQNSVVSRVKKRFYSLNSIVEEVSDGKVSGRIKNNFQRFENFGSFDQVLIVGGGVSPVLYSSALIEYLKEYPDIVIIFASSKNVPVFSKVPNKQIHCLAGNEGKRLEKLLSNEVLKNHFIILPPKHISENNYLPGGFNGRTFRIQDFHNINICQASATAFVMEIALRLNSKQIFLTGYDGYQGTVTREQLELFDENHTIFEFMNKNVKLMSLTSTQYPIAVRSIFAQL